jgi:hypothetical protein
MILRYSAGRRGYISGGIGSSHHVALLEHEATTLESAARVDGDLGPLYSWLPSRRWTAQMNAQPGESRDHAR